jgi:hypothetical protein
MAADSAVAPILDTSVSSPEPVLRQIRRVAKARTTPAKLRLLLVGLLVMTAVWGVVEAWTVAARASAANNIVFVSEPLTLDAQQLYRSLSDADATAATAFLSGGLEPFPLRERYLSDIAHAARLLEAATAAAGNSSAKASLSTLTAGLPVYTGLVETARADNRLGYPLGAAYLRQASAFMRATLLPAARDLYAQETGKLAAANDEATAFPYLGVVAALVVGFSLVGSQVWLTRRTKRIINPGLLLGSLAALAALIWLVTCVALARGHFIAARNQGSVPVEALARADIAALQAHADESLTLIDRQGDDSFQQDFLTLQKRLGPGPGTLLTAAATAANSSPGGPAAAAAVRNASEWFNVHKQVRALDDNGMYTLAVQLANGADPGDSGVLFGSLDGSLTGAIGADQFAFVNDALLARWNLKLLEAGVIVLSIVMAGGCAWGVSSRLVEYR